MLTLRVVENLRALKDALRVQTGGNQRREIAVTASQLARRALLPVYELAEGAAQQDGQHRVWKVGKSIGNEAEGLAPKAPPKAPFRKFLTSRQPLHTISKREREHSPSEQPTQPSPRRSRGRLRSAHPTLPAPSAHPAQPAPSAHPALPAPSAHPAIPTPHSLPTPTPSSPGPRLLPAPPPPSLKPSPLGWSPPTERCDPSDE